MLAPSEQMLFISVKVKLVLQYPKITTEVTNFWFSFCVTPSNF